MPVHVINGRMTKTSYECYRIIASALRSLPLRGIHAVSAEDAERFARLFDRVAAPDEPQTVRPATVDVMPNIKFDRAVDTLSAPPSLELAPLFRDVSPLILLASVRKEEETRFEKQ